MTYSVIELNSCFSQLDTKPFCILALKLPFRKCVTYALGCSFIKSSLLRRTFIVCCQLNNIKQHAWLIKKELQRKERFQSKSRGVFRIQSNICYWPFLRKYLMVTSRNIDQSWGRSPSLGFVSSGSQTLKLKKYIWYK